MTTEKNDMRRNINNDNCWSVAWIHDSAMTVRRSQNLTARLMTTIRLRHRQHTVQINSCVNTIVARDSSHFLSGWHRWPSRPSRSLALQVASLPHQARLRAADSHFSQYEKHFHCGAILEQAVLMLSATACHIPHDRLSLSGASHPMALDADVDASLFNSGS